VLSWLQVRVNLPNGDMVGHTGDLDATIVGCSVVDKAIQVFLFFPPMLQPTIFSTT